MLHDLIEAVSKHEGNKDGGEAYCPVYLINPQPNLDLLLSTFLHSMVFLRRTLSPCRL